MERRPQQPRIILTEEEYTDTLSDIIQRDFFPQVPDLERQAAILERRSNHDFAGAVAVRRAARRLQQHEEALADQEALEEKEGLDLDHGESDAVTLNLPRVRRTPRPLHRESVTGFHARVTNADNAEFDQQQQEELQAKREFLERVFRKGANQHLRITNDGEPQRTTHALSTPLLASDAYNASPHRITASEWKPTDLHNGFFFTPSINNNIKISNNDNDNDNVNNDSDSKSTTLLLTNSSNAGATTITNSMPPPAPKRKGQESALALPKSNALNSNPILEQSDLVEYIPKHVLEKKIEPSRTRFPSTLSTYQRRTLHAFDTASTSSSTEDYTTDASTNTDLDAPPRSLEQERQARNKRQRREQERLVAMTPLLAPGRDGVSASPMMTWGDVSSTPLVIGGATAVAASELVEPIPAPAAEQFFTLHAPSERDQRATKAQAMLAHQARQRISSSQLRRSNAAAATPASRLDSLTPAARSLLDKMTGSSSRLRLPSSATPRSREAFGTALRASYNKSSTHTPQRMSSNSSTLHSKRRKDASGLSKATPRRAPMQSTAQVPTSRTTSETALTTKNPTDGLLQLHR